MKEQAQESGPLPSLHSGPPNVVMLQSQLKPSHCCRHTPWLAHESSWQVVLGPEHGDKEQLCEQTFPNSNNNDDNNNNKAAPSTYRLCSQIKCHTLHTNNRLLQVGSQTKHRVNICYANTVVNNVIVSCKGSRRRATDGDNGTTSHEQDFFLTT